MKAEGNAALNGPGRNPNVIRASEVGEFVFCHRAWWFRHVQGQAPRNVGALQAGTAAHHRHGRLVTAAWVLRVLAIVLALGAAVALFAWLLAPG